MKVVQADAEVKKKGMNEQLEAIFDQFISKGNITEVVQVGDLKLLMRPLSTQEFLEAETVYVASVSSVPQDVVNRVRTISNLVHAVVAVNDIPMPTDKDELRDAQGKLNEMFMKLPPSVMDAITVKYREVVSKQSKLYEDVVDNIENF